MPEAGGGQVAPTEEPPKVEAVKMETEGPPEDRTVFVSNLSFKVIESELREIFSQVRATIIRGRSLLEGGYY